MAGEYWPAMSVAIFFMQSGENAVQASKGFFSSLDAAMDFFRIEQDNISGTWPAFAACQGHSAFAVQHTANQVMIVKMGRKIFAPGRKTGRFPGPERFF